VGLQLFEHLFAKTALDAGQFSRNICGITPHADATLLKVHCIIRAEWPGVKQNPFRSAQRASGAAPDDLVEVAAEAYEPHILQRHYPRKDGFHICRGVASGALAQVAPALVDYQVPRVQGYLKKSAPMSLRKPACEVNVVARLAAPLGELPEVP
jgi:hypothetical protein